MAINSDAYREIVEELGAGAPPGAGVRLVAVSKTKPVEEIFALYELGQRDFGENYVQEMADKRGKLPADIRWHFIGHLQSNKVKHILSFTYLIHGVDSQRLLKEIDRQAARQDKEVRVLLQVHIAREETKFGLDPDELAALMGAVRLNEFPYVRVRGLMGMASFTADPQQVREEFRGMKGLFDTYFATGDQGILSMGMSGDYKIAVEEGSTLVRVGTLLFGNRD